MSFAVVMEGMTLIAFLVVIAGGKQKRDSGWKVVSWLLVLVALIQCAAMALVVSFSSSLPPSDCDAGRKGDYGENTGWTWADRWKISRHTSTMITIASSLDGN